VSLNVNVLTSGVTLFVHEAAYVPVSVFVAGTVVLVVEVVVEVDVDVVVEVEVVVELEVDDEPVVDEPLELEVPAETVTVSMATDAPGTSAAGTEALTVPGQQWNGTLINPLIFGNRINGAAV